MTKNILTGAPIWYLSYDDSENLVVIGEIYLHVTHLDHFTKKVLIMGSASISADLGQGFGIYDAPVSLEYAQKYRFK